MYTSTPPYAGATHRHHFLLLTALLLAALFIGQTPLVRHAALTTLATPRQVNTTSTAVQPHLPLSFIPNVGQAAPEVQMEARIAGGVLQFRATEMTLQAGDAALRVQFVGANAHGRIHGVAPLPGVVNFYAGADPTTWRTATPTYAGVRYAELYPGIALVYNGDGAHIKGVYTVAASGDPAAIRWQYADATAHIDAQTGALHIEYGGATLVEHAPVAWQVIDGRQHAVEIAFRQVSQGVFGFAVGAYDAAYPLVIDPELVFSTLLGGNGTEYGRGIALDAQGNIYVVGATFSLDFAGTDGQTQAGGRDIFVSKLNADATQLLYSTYIGGRSSDEALAVAVNAAGEAYLTASVDSSDFPIQTTLMPNKPERGNSVLVKLNAQGGLAASTYLGIEMYNFYIGDNIDLDNAGNVYITGVDPMVVEGENWYGPQIALRKIDPAVTQFLLQRHYGGTDAEEGSAIDVGANGKIYLAGNTRGEHLPVTNGAIQSECGRSDANRSCSDDAVIVVADSTGNAEYISYLGGWSQERSVGIVADQNGNIVVAGNTFSSEFPVTQNAFQPTCPIDFVDNSPYCYYHTFVAKLTPTGNAFVFSTFLGSTGRTDQEYMRGVDVDAAGNVYVTGSTNGREFPIKDAIQRDLAGGICLGWNDRFCMDAFVTAFNPDGSLRYSTYLGGNFDEWAGGIAVRGDGEAYVTGYSDSSNSQPFPTTPGVVQPNKKVKEDVYIARIGVKGSTPPPPPPPPADLRNGNFDLGADGAWSESSSNFGGTGSLILDQQHLQQTTPRSGNYAAWLGGAPNEVADLSQSVVVAAAKPQLDFYYQIGSEDGCGADATQVLVGQTVVKSFELCQSKNTSGWTLASVDLSAYAGQSVTLRFRTTLNATANSNFFLDDVAFVAKQNVPGENGFELFLPLTVRG
ncbi:MAG TPA: hypothetical protein GX400_00035 [Chloroflexi bacterium]|nr:hypothetical protein [Chloroflexota bacterium]